MNPIQSFFFCAAFAAVLCGCTITTEPNRTKVTPESIAGGDWGFLQFSEVRAYRLNWDDEYAFEGLVGDNEKLNRTRVPKAGISLNKKQVAQLQQAVTGRHPSHPVAMCFYPHHAFAFYDDRGRVVGHIDVCFLCSNYGGKPNGFADNWDLSKLALLFNELGMPLSNPKWQ